MAPRFSSSRTQERATNANSSSHNATSAAQVFGERCILLYKETHALPETFKLKTCSSLLVSLAISAHVSHHHLILTVAAHPWWEKALTCHNSGCVFRAEEDTTEKHHVEHVIKRKRNQMRDAQAHKRRYPDWLGGHAVGAHVSSHLRWKTDPVLLHLPQVSASSNAAVGHFMCASHSARRTEVLLSICRSLLRSQQASPFVLASFVDHSAFPY